MNLNLKPAMSVVCTLSICFAVHVAPAALEPPWDGPPDRSQPGPTLGRGGPGGPMREKLKLVTKFDSNNDGYLDTKSAGRARFYSRGDFRRKGTRPLRRAKV